MISSFKKDFFAFQRLYDGYLDPILLFTKIYFPFFRCTASGTTLPIIWSESTRTTSSRYEPFCNANLRYLPSPWKVSMAPVLWAHHLLPSSESPLEKPFGLLWKVWGEEWKCVRDWQYVNMSFPAAKTSEVFGAELLEDAWDKQVHEADGEQGDGDPTFPLPGPHGLPPGAQRVAAETWRITGVGEGWIRSHCWSTGT